MSIKKILLSILCLQAVAVSANVLDFRPKSSSPLLYNMVDISSRNYSFSVSPFGGKSMDSEHMAEAITMNGKSYFTLNERGVDGALEVTADMNPLWIKLTSIAGGGGTARGTYSSSVQLKPQVKSVGALLHFYAKGDSCFIDVKSAIAQSKSKVEIIETGGGDGAFESIKTFADAMVNSSWNYGKMGTEQKKTGLDNVQVKLGFVAKHEDDSDNDNILMGYLLAEIPTGKGTKAEWAFEPRVGKNHFGIGVGFDEYYLNGDTQILVGANWRYLVGATEKRSFDLKNKPWSRYTRVISIPSTSTTAGTTSDGINALTLDAKVTPGNKLNFYVRCAQSASKVRCELGYNFFYRQQEKISNVADFASEFGIYDLYAGNHQTLNKANMKTQMVDALNAPNYAEDPGEALTKDDLDTASAAAGRMLLSSLAARCEYVGDHARFGVGGSVEGAHSKSAFASWNVWANLGVLF